MNPSIVNELRDTFFSQVTRYDYLHTLGIGGMGVVFKCRDRELGESIAVKVLFPDFTADQGDLLSRLRREVLVNRRIKHPNVARVFDMGLAGNLAFLTMEFIEGTPLSEVIKHFSPLPPVRVVPILRQVCHGLAAAHAVGVIHRDVKPANIMVDQDGAVAVLDFGLAALRSDPRLTREGFAMGTPYYMAPEQARGRAPDNRSDIFSIGVIAYECLTAHIPFPGQTPLEVALSVIGDPMPLEPMREAGVPGPLVRLIDRCLAKQPDSRPQSVEELAEALGLVSRAAPTEDLAYPVTPPEEEEIESVGSDDAVTTILPAQPLEFLTQPIRREAPQILVVDDDADLARFLVAHLAGMGYLVIHAEDGQRALEILYASGSFDLVLMDVMMPRMDGFDTTRVIKSQARFAGLPIILMSTFHQRNRLAFALQAGATAFLPKPLNLEALDTKVSELLALRRKIRS